MKCFVILTWMMSYLKAVKSWLLIKNISDVHHENLDKWSSKFRRFFMQILTACHEYFYHLSWKSQPFIKKLLISHHPNLEHLSENSLSFIKKILTAHHKNLNPSSWMSWPFIMKISTIIIKIWNCHHENLVVS